MELVGDQPSKTSPVFSFFSYLRKKEGASGASDLHMQHMSVGKSESSTGDLLVKKYSICYMRLKNISNRNEVTLIDLDRSKAKEERHLN